MKFETKCECLAHNMECGPDCGCAGSGACLNRSVTERRTLQLGPDVREIDSWGIDCYTRRNIHDGAPLLLPLGFARMLQQVQVWHEMRGPARGHHEVYPRGSC